MLGSVVGGGVELRHLSALWRPQVAARLQVGLDAARKQGWVAGRQGGSGWDAAPPGDKAPQLQHSRRIRHSRRSARTACRRRARRGRWRCPAQAGSGTGCGPAAWQTGRGRPGACGSPPPAGGQGGQSGGRVRAGEPAGIHSASPGARMPPHPPTPPHLEQRVHSGGGHPAGGQRVEQAGGVGPGAAQAVRVGGVVRLRAGGRQGGDGDRGSVGGPTTARRAAPESAAPGRAARWHARPPTCMAAAYSSRYPCWRPTKSSVGSRVTWQARR